MISKIYRLKETEVKKVLKYWKPFFSYWVVLNYRNNNLDFNRFSIIISWKNTRWWVERNFFRRKFYEIVEKIIKSKIKDFNYDLVFVVKKQVKLEKNDLESIKSFENDINFLIKKMNFNI